MSETQDLFLAPFDLWRRHGALNVIVTLGSPCVGLASAVVLLATDSISATSVIVLVLMLMGPLTNRQVLRSAIAIVSERPYLRLSGSGLQVDGCVFDSVCLAWADIDAMSPDPSAVREALESGNFLAMTFRVRSGPTTTTRSFSSLQHSVYPNYFEIDGYFKRPAGSVVDAVVKCFAANVRHHEPYLLSDIPD